jgi:hypothetical protein
MLPMMKVIPILVGLRESESWYVNAVGRRSGDVTRFGLVVRDAQGQLYPLPSGPEAESGFDKISRHRALCVYAYAWTEEDQTASAHYQKLHASNNILNDKSLVSGCIDPFSSMAINLSWRNNAHFHHCTCQLPNSLKDKDLISHM